MKMRKKPTTIVAILAVGALTFTGCGSAKGEALEPAAPATADPISPSLDDFVSGWNEATSNINTSWAIEDLPPVNEAGAFDVDLSPTFYMTGVLNPTTDQVVEIALFMEGTEVSRGNDDQEPDSDSGDHHGSTAEGDSGDHHGPTADGDGDHHAPNRPDPAAVPVELDLPTVRSAVSGLIRATSDAQPQQVEDLLVDLGVEAAAQLPASEADGELVEVVVLERNFHLQRFAPMMVVSVRAEEPWDFGDTN